ncbi:helix-turn-helix transcriptional regulator [Pseudactinotalea sp. HY158]|uniref:helix-turn-helix transcriptional regulator n=1 Tax=Pseudactinotalea sp. HY158 TaxID=2654547 RepID=UPI001E453CC6|nr:helix-turn-helix transcriptional regulator [Pseudactinotalea sp. HY158]
MPSESPVEAQLALMLALRLRHQREAVGLTQETAAERARISRNHYQLLESGYSDRAKGTPANPRLSTLFDLAHALDCTVVDLISGLAQPAVIEAHTAVDDSTRPKR